MSTTYINSLFDYKAPPTLDESTEYNVTKSSFVTLLEFNEDLILADLYSTRDFYKGLLESSDYVLNEGVFGAIGGFLSNAILTITNIFKYVFAGVGKDGKANQSHEKYERTINSNIKRINIQKEHFMRDYKAHRFFQQEREIEVYKVPCEYKIPTVDFLIGKENLAALNEVIKEANRICDGIKSKSIQPDVAKQDIQKLVAREKELTTAINGFDVTSGFSTEKQTVPDIGDYINNFYNNINRYSAFMEEKKKGDTGSVPEFKGILDNLEKFKNDLAQDNGQNDDLAVDIRSVAVSHTELAKAITDKINSYYTSTYISFTKETRQVLNIISDLLGLGVQDDDDESVDEMAYLENAIDAEMATYRWTVMEAYKEGIVKEAVIKANKDADVVYEMQVLNEGIAAKAKDALTKLIAKLKELFNRFKEKLRKNFTTDKHYITTYKKVILNNKVPCDFKANDIPRGIYASLDFAVEPFNYTAIKQYLTSNGTFFKYVTGMNRKFDPKEGDAYYTMPPGNVQDDLNAMATYFKEYFGVLEEGRKKVIPAATIQNSIKDLYDFVYDASKIDKALNKDLASIEKMKNEVIKQANQQLGTDTTTPPAQGQQPPVQGENVNGSFYYSYIDNLNSFLEADEVPTQAVSGNTNNANAQNTQNAAKPVYNDMTGRVNDNVARTNGKDANGQYNTTGANVDELNAHCDVYIGVVRTIITARLTALEALRKDCMDIFRAIVKRYVTGNGQSSGQNANNNQELIDMQRRGQQPQQ